LIGAGYLAVLLSQAPGQQAKTPAKAAQEHYREYFKQPETALEYWAAMNYEIEVGKFNLAAEDLKGFLAKKPTDEELLQLEEQEGISAFLRLLKIQELRTAAGPLVERVTSVVKKHRSDPERIRRLIGNLSATAEERAYAIGELRRSGAAAGPWIVQALQKSAGSGEHAAIVSALPELGPDILPPLLAALDSNDLRLQIELIDAFQKRNDAPAVPYLWYLSASSKTPELVRTRARDAIAYLLGTGVEKLPPARVALVQEAERYYRHQVRFTDPQSVVIWRWENNQVVGTPMTAGQAEEYYGLRFARQAIELDPTYEPAQVLFLSIAVDKAYERTGLDQPLGKGAPGVAELLKVVNPDLVNVMLDRALIDGRLGVILGAVKALGDFGDARALRPVTQKEPALARALYYGDRRVELAAADAILRIPGSERSAYGPRIVEILRREVAADPGAHAIVANDNLDRAHEMGHALQQIGFQPVVCRTGREVLLRLRQAADIDVLLIDYAIADPPLPQLLAQLRADANTRLLPVLVTVLPNENSRIPTEIEDRISRLIEPYPHVWLMPATLDSAFLKQTLARRLGDAMGQAFSDAERQANAGLAMTWLLRLSQGESPHYDVRPAAQAIFKALQSNALAPLATLAAGNLPGRPAQEALADVVIRSPQDNLRALAATTLARHIQRFGLALPRELVQGLGELFNATNDSGLKGALAMVIGSFGPNAKVTGERLERYRAPLPAPPAPAPAPAEPPVEK
jgi:CheY-like chemotaxis protein